MGVQCRDICHGTRPATICLMRFSVSPVAGSNSLAVTRSPGTVIGAPNTSSAVDPPMSLRGVVLIPSRTAHSSLCQSGLPSKRDFSDSFILRCCLSTSPFACGWYAVVRCILVPRALLRHSHTWPVNCAPLSEVRWLGTPNRATQCSRYASATNSAVAFGSGIASKGLSLYDWNLEFGRI